jgi:hypothetical protein
MEVSFQFTGDKEFLAKIKTFKETILDFKTDFTTIGEYLVRYYSTTPFFYNGTIYGKSWAPLAASTLAYKGKKFPGKPPLIRTGLMASSFAFQSSTEILTITNGAPYFKYHQSARPRRGHLPRRVIMAINKTLSNEIAMTMKMGIIERFNRI